MGVWGGIKRFASVWNGQSQRGARSKVGVLPEHVAVEKMKQVCAFRVWAPHGEDVVQSSVLYHFDKYNDVDI